MDQSMQRKGAFLLVWVLLVCCHRPPSGPPAGPAFYHWTTHLSVDSLEQHFLDALRARQLYVRYFDLDWDADRGEAVPLATVQFGHLPTGAGLTIVPTVFITNRCMQALSEADIHPLAQRVAHRLLDLHPASLRSFGEVQFDCDWTGGTQETYFAFLRAIRSYLPAGVRLSATIRLHQIAGFRQTGIPPVGEGVLMFYNMGQVDDWASDHSILHLPTAEPYLTDAIKRYPLSLRLALPLFSWGAVFRGSELLYLINNLRDKDLQDTLHFRPLGRQRYAVQKSTYLKSHFVYRGDHIRVEQVDPDRLRATARRLKEWLPPPQQHVVWYHLDSRLLKHWTHEELTEVMDLLD